MPGAFVFGYGSLAARGGERATLLGACRTWGVAMDNRETIPGYKLYLDARTGERPAVHVAFLDLAPDTEREVDGVLLAVTAGDLGALDARERNYRRVEVGDRLREPPGAPVFAYVGHDEARARLRRAREAGTAVVGREYHDAVVAGFAALGGDALERLARSTEPLGDLPLRDLRRIDLPARAEA